MYITIDEIKKHLNVDSFFKDDDDYIMSLVDTCEEAVGRHLDRPIETFVNDNGNLPAPIAHAVKLLVGNFYNNRESDAYVSLMEIPLGYRYLLDLYQDYKKKCY